MTLKRTYVAIFSGIGGGLSHKETHTNVRQKEGVMDRIHLMNT